MKSKIFIPIITIGIAAAVFSGLLRRSQNPYILEKPLTKVSQSQDQSLEHFFRESENSAAKEDMVFTTSFLAVGDISLSRNIAATIAKNKNPNFPFEKIAELLKTADFTFANLESPFSESDAFKNSETLIFNAPKNNILGLKENKINVLNLANNHAFDQKLNGITTTKSWLAEHNFQFMGTGQTIEEAWQPAYQRSNGINIGFIGASYASSNDGGKTSNNYIARIEDLDHLKYAIREAKTRADFIVVTMHAGTEYTRTPNEAQTQFAHKAVDFGADLVIGAHPHWVQTIEKYQGKYIFYSLGNFVFDQNWSRETKEGLALKIELEKTKTSELQGPKISAKIKLIELKPVIIEGNCCPRLADENESKTILNKINQASLILE